MHSIAMTFLVYAMHASEKKIVESKLALRKIVQHPIQLNPNTYFDEDEK